MILYFDSYITDIPLNGHHSTINDEVRLGCKNYAMPRKVDIAKYSLASYAVYPWKQVLIRYELDDENEYESFDRFILDIFPQAIIMHERSDSQADYIKSVEILDTIDDDWIFYSPNNDHPMMASDISHIDKLIKKAESYKIQYDYISIYYSHFSEFLNISRKKTPFNATYGYDTRTLKEDDLAMTIVRNDGDNTAVQIVNKNLFRYWFNSHNLGNGRIIRSEDVRKYFLTHNQLIINPKKEICAHFDGYPHTIGARHQITPDQVPPLFIPLGFFEKKVKIRYGYNDYKEGWTNINPSLKDYSFRNTKTGTDLKWTLEDIPLFWKKYITEIDANQDRDEDDLKKKRDENYQIVVNPWKDQWYYLRQMLYAVLDVIYYHPKQKLIVYLDSKK